MENSSVRMIGEIILSSHSVNRLIVAMERDNNGITTDELLFGLVRYFQHSTDVDVLVCVCLGACVSGAAVLRCCCFF